MAALEAPEPHPGARGRKITARRNNTTIIKMDTLMMDTMKATDKHMAISTKIQATGDKPRPAIHMALDRAGEAMLCIDILKGRDRDLEEAVLDQDLMDLIPTPPVGSHTF